MSTSPESDDQEAQRQRLLEELAAQIDEQMLRSRVREPWPKLPRRHVHLNAFNGPVGPYDFHTGHSQRSALTIDPQEMHRVAISVLAQLPSLDLAEQVREEVRGAAKAALAEVERSRPRQHVLRQLRGKLLDTLTGVHVGASEGVRTLVELVQQLL